MTPIAEVVAGLVSPLTKIVTQGQERKAAVEAADAKLAHAKLTGEQQLQFTQAEIEVLTKKNESSTWKDEVAMLTGLLPIYMVLLGSVLSAFGHPQFAEGTTQGLQQLQSMDIPIGEIAMLSIGAGLGIRLFRRR